MQGSVRRQKFRKKREPSKRLKESRDRRSDRRAGYGRDLEEGIASFLGRLQEAGEIASFIRYEPNSREDSQGKDFAVAKVVGTEKVWRHFGVTISPHSWHQSKLKHPNVPQFCFPIGTNPETIKKRILELFEV